MTRVRYHALRQRFLMLFSVTFTVLAVLLPISAWLENPSALWAQQEKPTPILTRADLEAVADESIVQITTTGRKSGKLRTATIWFVYEKNHLYIQSGQGGKTSWYRNLKKNRHIAMKIGDLTFTGQAHFIDDQKETERIHELFRSKYLRARLASWTGSQVGHGKVVEIELHF